MCLHIMGISKKRLNDKFDTYNVETSRYQKVYAFMHDFFSGGLIKWFPSIKRKLTTFNSSSNVLMIWEQISYKHAEMSDISL